MTADSPHRAPAPDPEQAGDGEVIRAIIRDLVAKQQALSNLIDRCLAGEDEPTGPRDLARLMSLHSQNAARLGRLLRDKRALSDDEEGAWQGAAGEALDALSAKWGVKL